MKNLNFFVIMFFCLSMALLSTSCQEDEPGDGGGVLDPGPILLECAYFVQGENRLLVNDPDRAVDYVVPCKALVDVDVIIEAGTVIEFEIAEAGLAIRDGGSLSAIGTADEMIVFTGVDKAKGSWAGINFDSADPKNHLSYCHVNYGGGHQFSSNGFKANIVALSGSKSTIDNCIIENSFTYGINAPGRESHFNALENNLFKNNQTPIYANASVAYLVDKTNTFEGNTNSYVEVGVGGAFYGFSGNTLTWQDLDVPYRIAASGEISIGDGEYLILEPGVELVFSVDAQIKVGDGGAFKAAGEEGGKQILMTGAEAIPGFWNGIEFAYTTDPRNEISHATLEYGAGPNLDGMILMRQDPKITVHNVTFRELQNCAFYEEDNCFCNENLTEYDNTFENVGGTYCFNE